MSIAGGLVTFVILWMLVLFLVLPFGIRTADETGEPKVPGQADSAPVRPRLWLKAAITTGLAIVLWAVAYAVIAWRLIPLEALPGDWQ